MFIRMVWGKLRAGSWEEFERHYHERVATGAPPKGLKERQLIRSTEDPDEGISVSVWDTLGDLRAYETSEIRANSARQGEHLYRGEYWAKHFEVASTD